MCSRLIAVIGSRCSSVKLSLHRIALLQFNTQLTRRSLFDPSSRLMALSFANSYRLGLAFFYMLPEYEGYSLRETVLLHMGPREWLHHSPLWFCCRSTLHVLQAELFVISLGVIYRALAMLAGDDVQAEVQDQLQHDDVEAQSTEYASSELSAYDKDDEDATTLSYGSEHSD